MPVREAGSRAFRGDPNGTDRAALLRSRWRTASVAAGWRFPSDWGVPEVDRVCAAVAAGLGRAARGLAAAPGPLDDMLAELARARAHTGAGLDETLVDLAALHAVLTGPASPDGLIGVDPDAAPTRLLRVMALAWADASFGELGQREALETRTNLTTDTYLRTRLGEVYRQARRDGRSPAERHVLVVLTLDLSDVDGYSRVIAMVLAADAVREVFDGGESVALLGPSVVVVMAERDAGLARRIVAARMLVSARLAADPALLAAGWLDVRVERLPGNPAGAAELLNRVRRA